MYPDFFFAVSHPTPLLVVTEKRDRLSLMPSNSKTVVTVGDWILLGVNHKPTISVVAKLLSLREASMMFIGLSRYLAVDDYAPAMAGRVEGLNRTV
ncbi:hypothetical protein [uncultured Ferrimonas sp.]|uniref:hypothetical protein n=1 Tax=uncultured Ferrimonas sp. TaxID=432640 RepID=UPI002636E37B|nr:hypothetical protein [uncultured Ferrimonas sp.]